MPTPGPILGACRRLAPAFALLCSGTAGTAGPYDAVGSRIPFDPTNALDIAAYCDGSDSIDDTEGINAWLTDAESLGKDLFVSPGTYYYARVRYLWSGVRMRGAGPYLSVFKSLAGTNGLFTFTSEWDPTLLEPFDDIVFENLGFDLNGDQASNFLSVIAISGREHPATHITVRGNRFFDSVLQDSMYTDPGHQRQYVVLVNVEDVLVEGNDLSAGGRIKVGSPGQRIVIRDNHLFNINDNGITIANNRGPNVTQHVLIEGNTVINPISAGIFWGSDGEMGGARGQSFYDITIRNNSVTGDFASAGIWGMTSDHTERISIEDNFVSRTGDSGVWAVGLGISRSDSSFHATRDVLIEGNQIVTVPPGNFDNLAAMFLRGEIQNLCLVENEVSPVPTALYLAGPVLAQLFDNDFHGGGVRLESGAAIDSTGNVSDCFAPIDPPVSLPDPGQPAGLSAVTTVRLGPNPFGSTLHVEFSDRLDPTVSATLFLYDVSGRLAATVVESLQGRDWAEFRLEAGRLSAGTYLALVRAGATRFAQKVVKLPD